MTVHLDVVGEEDGSGIKNKEDKGVMAIMHDIVEVGGQRRRQKGGRGDRKCCKALEVSCQ